MRAYSVPIVTHLVEIDYAGEALTGRVFLPTHSDRHEGDVRLDEWINEPRPFFPFLPDGERETVLLSKAWIACLSVDTEGWGPPAAEPPMRRLEVVVEHAGRRTEGWLGVDLPPPRQRLLDTLNLPEAFLTVWTETRLLLIPKRVITRVQEAEGLS